LLVIKFSLSPDGSYYDAYIGSANPTYWVFEDGKIVLRERGIQDKPIGTYLKSANKWILRGNLEMGEVNLRPSVFGIRITSPTDSGMNRYLPRRGFSWLNLRKSTVAPKGTNDSGKAFGDPADIARLNLRCAQGLVGAENLDRTNCWATLNQMATRVKSETARHFYRFQSNASEFENSEGFFRMVMMAIVLAEDFGVHYAPDKIKMPSQAQVGDGFFADASDVFLHGLLGAKRQGTCSSLPVLYVAVGRRLGYPLKLVTTKGHLFVRWEDAKERFNSEAAGKGVNRFSDDYYRHWPYEVSDDDIRNEGYLKSLSPGEELAVFLSIRAACLREAGRNTEAAEALQAASKLAPQCQSYKVLLSALPKTDQKSITATQ
jgi:hypothetical protein